MTEVPNGLAKVCQQTLQNTKNFTPFVSDFRCRPQQLEMTQNVADAIVNKETLLIEAGTGIGKTFAYLLPAILSGKKIVISTHTRYLQDQIFHNDLPAILAILDETVDIVLLKGRRNYLCLEHLHNKHHSHFFEDENNVIEHIAQWSKTTKNGDISEFNELAEDDKIWNTLSSTSETCLGSKCEFYKQCFVVKAREAAIKADIVIVNHYLLFADMTLKEEGFGQLLPQVDSIIIDEAHHIKTVADNFLGESLSSRQIQNLLDDIRNEDGIADTPELLMRCDQLENATEALKKYLQTVEARGELASLLADNKFLDIKQNLDSVISELIVLLDEHQERSEKMANHYQFILALKTQYAGFFNLQSMGNIEDEEAIQDTQMITWYQREKNSFQFFSSPAEIAPLLQEKHNVYKANWIYTSATLSVNGKFDYIMNTLGINPQSKCIILDSPFNYREQAALYFPKHLPNPNEAGYTDCLIEACYPLLNKLTGSCFFLFTSHKALKSAAEKMKRDTNFPLLVQGTMPKRELIRSFYETPKAILLGSASFWAGVDVRGAGLQCVIIDRLPFSSPNDPLIKGRIRIAESRGEDFFMQVLLPEAVVVLRQGIGRLIRDEYDSGIIVIGDNRIYKKGYGKVFLKSLPDMQECRDIKSLMPYINS